LIRKGLEFCLRNDLKLQCNNVEEVWIECNIANQKSIFGVVYRHPGGHIPDFKDKMESVVCKIQNETGRAFICGDFNIDGTKVLKDQKTTDFYNALLTQNIVPTITLPTRITEHSVTLIDNIFMKIDASTIEDEILTGNIFSDISDHLPNFMLIKLTMHQVKNKLQRPKIGLFGDKNIAKFRESLAQADWSEVYVTENTNQMVSVLQKNFSENFNKSFPLTSLSRKRAKDKIWVTASLRKSIRHKATLYKKYLNNPTAQNKDAYKQYKNKLTSILRDAPLLQRKNRPEKEKYKSILGNFWTYC
jgi:hypothetical protein